jgi:hypothetical protein
MLLFVWMIYLLAVLAHTDIDIMAVMAENKDEETNIYIPFEIIKKIVS